MKRSFLFLLLLLNSGLAALGGGTLAFGVLELSMPITIIFALTLALTVGAIWIWAQRSPDRARRLRVITVIFVLAISLLSLAQMQGAGQILVNTTNREENFTQLCRVMGKNYPYFKQKGIDWDAACRRYQPLVKAAQTDTEYHILIANLLSELGDAHTSLIQPNPAPRRYFGLARLFSDGVALVEPGDFASKAGMKRGAEILAVDGMPVEQALQNVPYYLRSGSTPWQSRTWAAFHLLSTTGDTLTITYRNPSAEVQTTTLRWQGQPSATLRNANEPLIDGEILPSGWGLIRLPTFSQHTSHNLVREFDRTLDQVHTASGLILDLRGNGGGDSRLAELMAGRFFSQRFCYGQDHFRQRLPMRGWSRQMNYCVQPRGETVTLPLILLVDSRNMSSAEQFIAIFVESRRALTVGERTGGASGNPITFPLPAGGLIRFSTGVFSTRSGYCIEGSGIQPDISVFYTIADFQLDRDPALLAAESISPDQLDELQITVPVKESPVIYVKLFGYFLAFTVLLTSIAIALMGARWQAVEQSAYAGERRPWWFVVGSILLFGFYLFALYHFSLSHPKTWASWLMMVFLPIGWGLKGALVVFNPKGRSEVSAITGDQKWRRIALARLPIAILLGVLAWFA